MYRIRLTSMASQQLKVLDARTREKIIARIEELKQNPVLLGKPLVGPLKELRVLRAAGQRYRIIYNAFDAEVVVVVVAVGIRKEGSRNDIYQLMKKYIRTGLLELD